MNLSTDDLKNNPTQIRYFINALYQEISFASGEEKQSLITIESVLNCHIGMLYRKDKYEKANK